MAEKEKGSERYWIGCDLGGTKLLTVVFDGNLKTLGRLRLRHKDGFQGKDGIRYVGDAIEDAMRKTGIAVARVKGIGFGTAGFLDLEQGILIHSPNLGWHNLRIQEGLTKRFGVPVSLLNDVDAGTYGEYRLGAARHARCLVGVFPGTGIGGACIYDGHLIRGKTASAMEVGHICVQPDGNLCGCGRYGCLETVASRLAIASQIAAAAYRHDTPELRKLVGTDVAKIRSGVIAAALKAGDAVVDKIVRHAARRIGAAMVTPLHLLAPDTILLGGGLVEQMPDLFVNAVREVLHEQGIASFVKNLNITAAALGDDAVVKGAAAFAADTGIQA